eukprot:scaffold638446_cov17-Prasinocladus_malaysianus.AAC.1
MARDNLFHTPIAVRTFATINASGKQQPLLFYQGFAKTPKHLDLLLMLARCAVSVLRKTRLASMIGLIKSNTLTYTTYQTGRNTNVDCWLACGKRRHSVHTYLEPGWEVLHNLQVAHQGADEPL